MGDALEFAIDTRVVEAFPEVQVLAIRARIEDQSALITGLQSIGPRIEASVSELAAIEPLSSLPNIARWRMAYGQLGVKPSKFLSSIEALLKRAKKGQMADIGIPVVDLYNAVSVLHRVPMGAYDADRLSPVPLIMRLANPEEDAFTPLGGRSDDFPLNPKLVVYAQNDEVLCWGFNTRDSAKSAVTEASRDVLFFSETSVSDGRDDAVQALEHLSEIIAAHGGQVSKVAIFDAVHSSGLIAALD
ncbi:MAG: hypothetical protein GKR98_17655 [Boseongicola sp.]|nr:MAG: hypothetical protein GKR98_17655 [Boseongicola sp.]